MGWIGKGRGGDWRGSEKERGEKVSST